MMQAMSNELGGINHRFFMKNTRTLKLTATLHPLKRRPKHRPKRKPSDSKFQPSMSSCENLSFTQKTSHSSQPLGAKFHTPQTDRKPEKKTDFFCPTRYDATAVGGECQGSDSVLVSIVDGLKKVIFSKHVRNSRHIFFWVFVYDFKWMQKFSHAPLTGA